MTVAYVNVDIAALKRRHPLSQVVEASGVELRGRGRVRQGLCPFHEEREGSFTVYADSQRWYCFGCGLGGDALDFIQRREGLSLPEAIRRLDRSGQTSSSSRSAVTERRPAQPPAVRDSVLLTAARFYAGQLERSLTAQRYLASRGVNLAAARRLSLGYAAGQGLREHLLRQGFDQARLGASGLFGARGERFAGMIIVPELVGGRVHWLAGRAIRAQVQPRFQALPGPKPALGLRSLPSPAPWILVAEGLFDWLLLAAWGLPACAALGTQGMDKLASALRGQARVFLAFDADAAGREAAHQLGARLGSHRSAVVTLPDGITDVAELGTRPNGRARFLQQLRRAASAAR